MTIGIGVIGTGFMGRTWTEVASNHVAETQVLAVAGGSRAARLASDYRVALESDPNSLLARRDIELVVVATPPDAHRDLAVAAARAGKHCLVEKPMAMNVAESDAMVAVADQSGTTLAVVSQHRFRGAARAAHDLLVDGSVGRLRMVQARGIDTATEAPLPNILPYADMGSHVCDVLRWLVDSSPVRAYGEFQSFTAKPPPYQSAMAQYAFANGVMASVWISYDIPSPGLGSMLSYLLVGSEGMIELDSYGQVRLGKGERWEVAFEQQPFDPNDPNDPVRLKGYADEMRDVLSAIESGRPPLVNGRWARGTQEMLDAVRISAANHQPVELPLEAALVGV